ncbi:MAG TPA: cupin domain-containing protein [Candidatus Limnocylindria bacterium]|jgi:quercetin dioxygenase-like cupin family protein
MDARVITPEETTTLRLYDVVFRWGIGAAETDGSISILEVTIPPHTLIKPHAHTREDEFSYVLAGPIGVRAGDTTHESVPTGSWLIKPRSVPHAMWNVGDEPARVLEIVAPGGLETYFQTIAPILLEHGPDWTARYNEAADAYGLEIVNAWSEELQDRYGITL